MKTIVKFLCFVVILSWCYKLILIVSNQYNNQYNKRHYQAVLTSDRPWPIGEARPCSFDGQWKELHCFPPEKVFVTPKYEYAVETDFDKPVHFDKDQWAYNIVCRLDSFKQATCRTQEAEPKKD